MKQKIKQIIQVTIFTSSLLLGCGGSFRPEVKDATQTLSNSIGCNNFRQKFWNMMYDFTESKRGLPGYSEIERGLKKSLELKAFANLEPEPRSQLGLAVVDLYKTIAETPEMSKGKLLDARQLLVLSEFGAAPNPALASLKSHIDDDLTKIDELTHILGATCQTPDGTSSGTSSASSSGQTGAPVSGPGQGGQGATTLLQQWSLTQPKPVYGAWKVMATAYQSCDVVGQLPLTSKADDVQGIQIIGQYPDGVGNEREISNASLVVSTDQYYNNYRLPSLTSCVDVRPNPLIYNYGGKPTVLAASGPGEMDLFKNFGNDTPALGVDCSGFVTTSLLAAGLKLNNTAPIRAVQSQGISSSMFKDPKANGLTCLNPITLTTGFDLKGGDIIAINGHVVMVDQVGSDPFGISGITKMADCTSSKVALDGFDFSIVQSAAALGGIGINRFRAADYFINFEPEMGTGLIGYAQAACYAKFGTPSTPNVSTLSVVRHSLTSDCMDSEVALTHSDCVNQCAASQVQALVQ